jgi:hypothetical protein
VPNRTPLRRRLAAERRIEQSRQHPRLHPVRPRRQTSKINSRCKSCRLPVSTSSRSRCALLTPPRLLLDMSPIRLSQIPPPPQPQPLRWKQRLEVELTLSPPSPKTRRPTKMMCWCHRTRCLNRDLRPLEWSLNRSLVHSS